MRARITPFGFLDDFLSFSFGNPGPLGFVHSHVACIEVLAWYTQGYIVYSYLHSRFQFPHSVHSRAEPELDI